MKRLLERGALLAALRTYLHDAASGDGRLILVAGEAGVGKSVLIEQLKDENPELSWFFGACDGLSTPRPLAPLFDLAEQLGGPLLELCGDPSDRDLLFRVMLQQLAGATHQQVVVVEDVHWADEATVDLLRFLGPRIRSLPVVLILTYRDDSPHTVNALGSALGELGMLRWSRRLTVPPLSRAAVGQLAVGTVLDPDDLFHLTGGNPFHVTELVEAGVPTVTASARDAILARAANLTTAARALLDSAAVMGGRVKPGVLTAVDDCSSVEMDELVSSGLLVDDGPNLRFRHEIARLAVDGHIPMHRRITIHARALAVMLAAGECDDSRLAFHADGAGNAMAALHHASRAAQRAAQLGSHREAAAQFARALRYRTVGSPRVQAALCGGLADELMLADACQAAAEAYEQALELWRNLGDRLQEGKTLHRYAAALLNLCRGSEARAAAERAVAVLQPQGDSVELSAALSSLATFALMGSDVAAATALAGQAEELGRRVSATDVIADALNTRGCASSGADPAWTELVRRALELAMSHNHQAQAARAYCNLYAVLADQYRYAEAEQFYRDGIAYCKEHDLNAYLYSLHATRAMVLLNQGRWDEVLEVGQPLLDNTSTAPISQICLSTRIGIVQVRRQDPAGWDTLNRATESALSTGQPQHMVPILLARAEARWLQGRISEARDEAEAALDSAVHPDPWMLGAVDSWLRRTGSLRRRQGTMFGPYELQRLGLFAEAAAQWEALGCHYDAAMALLEAGDASSMRTALRTLHKIGAKALASWTRQQMRSKGIRFIPAGPRTAARKHPFGLTLREQEVFALMTERHTNAQIAHKLFISPKTVDHHVSAVLTKLDVNSREQAVHVGGRRQSHQLSRRSPSNGVGLV